MKVVKGPEGLRETWQDDFPKEVSCTKCGGTARHAFTAIEGAGEDSYVSHFHNNEGPGGYWLHDACAVAVYFCRDCFHCEAEWNQA